MRKIYNAVLGELSVIFFDFHSWFKEHDFHEEMFFASNLVIEELFTNIVNYAYPEAPADNGDVIADISFSKTETGRIKFIFRDKGIPFNPLEYNTASADMNDRIGGLGIFLVKKYTEEFSYRRVDGYNETTAIVGLNKPEM